MSPPAAAEHLSIVSLELFGALGPGSSRIGVALDASIVPQVGFELGIAEAGGDGWSGPQISAAVRGRFALSPRHRSLGLGVSLARGPYAYAPLIGEFANKTWSRAYLLRVQASTESSGTFHTRWFIEVGGVLNPKDFTCPEFEYCGEGSGWIVGVGLAVAYSVL